MRQIYSLLGGDNQAVKDAYSAFFGRSVQADMRAHLNITDLTHGLAYARYGKADIASRVQAVTWDIIGTDEDKLYQILEAASLDERLALANNPVAMFYIQNDTSGAVRERCMIVLRPLMNHSGLSAAARAALFEHIRQEEAELGNAVATLMTRLRARKGWFNDDEDGMISDVDAWVAGWGGGFPDLDAQAGEPARDARGGLAPWGAPRANRAGPQHAAHGGPRDHGQDRRGRRRPGPGASPTPTRRASTPP